MITDRDARMGANDWLGMVLVVLISVISFIGLQTMEVGSYHQHLH